jgi:hypothetical protein
MSGDSWFTRVKNSVSSFISAPPVQAAPLPVDEPQATPAQVAITKSLNERFLEVAERLEIAGDTDNTVEKFLIAMARIEEIQERIEEKD